MVEISTSDQPSIRDLVLKLKDQVEKSIAEHNRWEKHWKSKSTIHQDRLQYSPIQQPEISDQESSEPNPTTSHIKITYQRSRNITDQIQNSFEIQQKEGNSRSKTSNQEEQNLDLHVAVPNLFSGGSRRSRGAEVNAFTEKREKAIEIVTAFDQKGNEGGMTSIKLEGKATVMKPFTVVAATRDPSQRRTGETHRFLTLVPAAALLAAVLPWNRNRDPREEDEAESVRRPSSCATDGAPWKLGNGGQWKLDGCGDTWPVMLEGAAAKAKWVELQEVMSGLEYSHTLGSTFDFEAQIINEGTDFFICGPNLKVVVLLDQSSTHFCLVLVDEAKFYSWDPGGKFYFSRSTEIK